MSYTMKHKQQSQLFSHITFLLCHIYNLHFYKIFIVIQYETTLSYPNQENSM